MRWSGKKVLILGAARQGVALARFLSESGAEVTLNDRAPLESLEAARSSLGDQPIKWETGSHPIGLLDGMDLVCLSGGIPISLPLVSEAIRRNIPLSNDSQIFLEEAPCPVVGITGSAGKTTTTALLGEIAARAVGDEGGGDQSTGSRMRSVWVGGNIGHPLISEIGKMQSQDLAIMELSSFQLELMDRSPQVAVVLNLTPNHLDRHQTMQAYTAAKRKILSFQDSADTAVLGCDDPGSWSLRSDVRGRLVSFGWRQPDGIDAAAYVRDGRICFQDQSREEALTEIAAIRLRGAHNVLNVLAAAATARAIGFPPRAIRSGVEGFSGLPHRLEWVRDWGGASWFNDSIATAPERAVAALRAFDPPIVLLAGGRDKDLPWSGLAEEARQRVDHLIAFGEAAPIVLQAVGESGHGRRPFTTSLCLGLRDAVREAARLVEPGDTVLLAPGGTSFDEFQDFEERGEQFKRWVNQLS